MIEFIEMCTALIVMIGIIGAFVYVGVMIAYVLISSLATVISTIIAAFILAGISVTEYIVALHHH